MNFITLQFMIYKNQLLKLILTNRTKKTKKTHKIKDPVIYGLVPFKSSISQLSVSCWRPPKITCATGGGLLLIYRKFGGKDIRLAKRTNHFLKNGKIGSGRFFSPLGVRYLLVP